MLLQAASKAQPSYATPFPTLYPLDIRLNAACCELGLESCYWYLSWYRYTSSFARRVGVIDNEYGAGCGKGMPTAWRGRANMLATRCGVRTAIGHERVCFQPSLSRFSRFVAPGHCGSKTSGYSSGPRGWRWC